MEFRAPWLFNLTNILKYEGFPEAGLIFYCGKADVEAAAEALNKHGLTFWSNIFSQFGKLREKSFKQERRKALREGRYDLVFKLYRGLSLFGKRKVSRGSDIRNSLSCSAS